MSMGESAYGCATPQGIMRLLGTLRDCSIGQARRGRGQKPYLWASPWP